ncbi:MAG TPA: glycoside hydrolase family 16 protein [Candidatus Avoscillospira stercoripullorum]|uniref:licheninase n=1 Tax=Candidatus Avoscillospira stercoripullorum TaxID=2840709 RepID=A0A9D1A766_9FIRM|nr:glycoside hydrolase family 16 protein [Candidatus Avoscillospira stercoripullorum]
MQQTLSYEGYTLVFEDNFDSRILNRENWVVEQHEPGWVNAEWQRYVDSPETVFLREGKLCLKSVKTVEADGTISYASGRISTEHKQDFTYGIFEARLKVPRGAGLLPAFWLMATDEERYGNWPCCGEIDIMEIKGQDSKTNYATIHFGLPHQQRQGVFTLEAEDFADSFHTFSLEWLPGMLRWYVDGKLFFQETSWYSTDAQGVRMPFPAPFDHKMYLILNLAVGGNWVGYPDETTEFDAAIYAVDYVKVYQITT